MGRPRTQRVDVTRGLADGTTIQRSVLFLQLQLSSWCSFAAPSDFALGTSGHGAAGEAIVRSQDRSPLAERLVALVAALRTAARKAHAPHLNRVRRPAGRRVARQWNVPVRRDVEDIETDSVDRVRDVEFVRSGSQVERQRLV